MIELTSIKRNALVPACTNTAVKLTNHQPMVIKVPSLSDLKLEADEIIGETKSLRKNAAMCGLKMYMAAKHEGTEDELITWLKSKKRNSKRKLKADLLLELMKLLVTQDNKQASKYARALKCLLAEKIAPEKLPKKIKEFGLNGLAERYSNLYSPRAKAKPKTNESSAFQKAKRSRIKAPTVTCNKIVLKRLLNHDGKLQFWADYDKDMNDLYIISFNPIKKRDKIPKFG